MITRHDIKMAFIFGMMAIRWLLALIALYSVTIPLWVATGWLAGTIAMYVSIACFCAIAITAFVWHRSAERRARVERWITANESDDH